MSLQQRLANWLGVAPERVRDGLNPAVPEHMKHWWYALGVAPAFLFVVQIVSGILLALHYQAGPDTAYDSVYAIEHQARFGWYVRAVHAWGATLFLATALLHQLRVFFCGGYRNRRAATWLLGCALLFGGLAAGLTGYGLTGDQRSFWGLTVAAGALGDLPLVGPTLARSLLGADAVSRQTLPRLFALHAVAIPMVLALLAVAHIALVRIQGLSGSDGEQATPRADATPGRRFFPEHAATELGVVLALVVLLNVLAATYPPALGPRADLLTTPETIRAEWYFYPASRLLAVLPRSVALATLVAALGAIMGFPWLDRWLRRRRRWRELGVWLGAVAVLALLGLTVWEAVLP